jgi:hypothetical protein
MKLDNRESLPLLFGRPKGHKSISIFRGRLQDKLY